MERKGRCHRDECEAVDKFRGCGRGPGGDRGKRRDVLHFFQPWNSPLKAKEALNGPPVSEWERG